MEVRAEAGWALLIWRISGFQGLSSGWPARWNIDHGERGSTGGKDSKGGRDKIESSLISNAHGQEGTGINTRLTSAALGIDCFPLCCFYNDQTLSPRWTEPKWAPMGWLRLKLLEF